MTSEETKINKLVGIRITTFRKMNELSRGQLGAVINVGHQQMGRLERGDSTISPAQIIKIAKALNIEPSHLLDIDQSFSDEELSYIYQVLKSQKDSQRKQPKGYIADLIRKVIELRD